MISTDNITGLILAGGAGRRVGHRDKGLLTWQGKPLVAHVHDCLQPQVGRLLISCNRNFASYHAFAALTVADGRDSFQGPLAGIEAAIPHVDTEFLVVVSCDMPQLPADLVQRLIAPLHTGKADGPQISYAHDGVRAQYLCAAMKRESLATLPGFLDAGHRAVKDWYSSRRTTIVDFANQATCFVNFNELG
jgi:molybdopterin-guanine dinucleotide biosynthesis protein A